MDSTERRIDAIKQDMNRRRRGIMWIAVFGAVVLGVMLIAAQIAEPDKTELRILIENRQTVVAMALLLILALVANPKPWR